MNPLKFLRKQNWFKIFLFYFFRIFPIQKNKIIFCNFSGKRCSDSPRAISNWIQKKHPDLDIVWLIHPDYKPEVPKGTRAVNFGMHSIKMIYELATAKVWVDSHTKFVFTRKRRQQFYMETWHGGICLKKIEGDAAESLDKTYLDRVRNNSKMANVFLSNSEWVNQLYRRAFWFQGEILTFGLPRNDVLTNASANGNVHQKFQIPADTKILLYAPTFRVDESTDCYALQTDALLKTLKYKTQSKWKILIRLHPVVMQKKCPIEFNENVLDATAYPDMQELLLESDTVITDYSSCIFDFAILRRPAFLFATDIPTYQKDRDLYFDIRKLPFPLAENNNALCQNILNFDLDAYKKSFDEFFNQVKLCESGSATQKAVEKIESWMEI